MEAREVQQNLAEKLVRTGLENVVIVGKAYKPHVHYVDGSYSLLVGHYVEKFMFLFTMMMIILVINHLKT